VDLKLTKKYAVIKRGMLSPVMSLFASAVGSSAFFAFLAEKIRTKEDLPIQECPGGEMV
jgi:hypothetical protein